MAVSRCCGLAISALPLVAGATLLSLGALGCSRTYGGIRASGTPGYDASLAYVKEQLEATDYDDVTVQEFTYDGFRELAPAEMEQISPNPRPYDNAGEDAEVATMDYSDTGDVTGTLVATNDIVIPPGAEASTSNSGCEAADFTPASETEPQIALIQRGTCDFHVKAENAEAAGYDAAIIFNEGQPGRDGLLFGTLTADDLSTIPVVGTSFAVGEELYTLLQDEAVTMRVATTGEILLDQETANLIATTKTGRTDRQVVVGAHLDSVFEGPGINDNGSGSSQDLEIALQMAELGIQPRTRSCSPGGALRNRV
jgi:Zn-dependent M28 family amino/carboxypeptidase